MHSVSGATPLNPAGHSSLQFCALGAPGIECLPSMHAAHVLSLVAFVTLEYLPASQSVHALEPMPWAYVPAGHGMHCWDNGTLSVILLVELKNPALHSQYFLSVSGFECTGHAVHGAEPVTSL
jgi:hypothetical protein